MKQMAQKAGGLQRGVRNRMRSVSKRVIAIAHALRHKGAEGELKRKKEYRQRLRLTRQILNDSQRVHGKSKLCPARVTAECADSASAWEPWRIRCAE